MYKWCWGGVGNPREKNAKSRTFSQVGFFIYVLNKPPTRFVLSLQLGFFTFLSAYPLGNLGKGQVPLVKMVCVILHTNSGLSRIFHWLPKSYGKFLALEVCMRGRLSSKPQTWNSVVISLSLPWKSLFLVILPLVTKPRSSLFTSSWDDLPSPSLPDCAPSQESGPP